MCGRKSVWLLAVAAVALSACGGGGGGDSAKSRGTISLSPESLTFSADSIDAMPPPQQTLQATVTGVTSSNLYLIVELSGGVVSRVDSLQVTSETTGTANVVPVWPHVLGAGTHFGTIRVLACTSKIGCASQQLSGSPKIVNVTYTIAGIAASAEQLDFVAGSSSTAAELTQALTLTGYPSQNWTATSDKPWLHLSATSGSTANPTALQVFIDESEGRLPNGRHIANLTLTPVTGKSVQVPVTLDVQRAQVDFVAPYVAVSGQSREVIIRGNGFDAAAVNGVRFGELNATAFRVVSSTEIRATHPALAAGEYPVVLQGGAANVLSLAKLVAIDPPTYQATALQSSILWATSFRPVDLVYDNQRRRIYVMSRHSPYQGNDIVAGEFSGMGWNLVPQTLSPIILDAIAMSTDGTSLVTHGLSGAACSGARWAGWRRRPLRSV